MNSEIEKLSNKLEQSIHNPNCSMDDIFEISCAIDREIEKTYIKVDNTNIEEQLKQYFDRVDKETIIKQIKEDLLDNYKNISLVEMEILSKHIYEYCCLKNHKIDDKKIKDYILYKNNSYYATLPEKIKNKEIGDDSLLVIKKLVKKYLDILR